MKRRLGAVLRFCKFGIVGLKMAVGVGLRAKCLKGCIFGKRDYSFEAFGVFFGFFADFLPLKCV